MEKVTIRLLKREDASQVALLIPQLKKNIFQPEKLKERIETLAGGDYKKDWWFVAVKDGKIVGFGGMTLSFIPSKGDVGWIEELVVDQDHQRKGIDQMLIEEFERLAKNKDLVQVKLTTANGDTKYLYQKHGFSEGHEILMVKKYYQNPKPTC